MMGAAIGPDIMYFQRLVQELLNPAI